MSERRAGYALVLTVLAVALAGALIVATHAIVTLEHATAAVAMHRQRAFAASEHALWTSVAELASTEPGLDPGQSATRLITVARDSVTVTTVRLNQDIYWIAADAAVSDGSFRARRRTGTNVRVEVDSSGRSVSLVPRAWVEVH